MFPGDLNIAHQYLDLHLSQRVLHSLLSTRYRVVCSTGRWINAPVVFLAVPAITTLSRKSPLPLICFTLFQVWNGNPPSWNSPFKAYLQLWGECSSTRLNVENGIFSVNQAENFSFDSPFASTAAVTHNLSLIFNTKMEIGQCGRHWCWCKRVQYVEQKQRDFIFQTAAENSLDQTALLILWN